MRRRASVILSVCLAMVVVGPLMATAQVGSSRTPMTIEGKQTLPLRVLSRAFAKIYQKPDTAAATVNEKVPAFQSFYVYAHQPSNRDLGVAGWYEVGSDSRGTVLGWMSEDDVFEWKQTMCLSYTHPEGRYPVLMFQERQDVERLVGLDPKARTAAVGQYYMDIALGEIPENYPVVTVEPEKAIDISKEFYLLPILDFSPVELDNREARMLKLAAVTREEAEARVSSDIRTNQDYLQQATQRSTDIDAALLKKLKVDVVWVMDTTNSMMPYITQTLKVVEAASKSIAAKGELAEAVRFGIWGYRDALEIPDIGYNVRNYTPELQTVEQFAATLKTVQVTEAGSQGYDEDVFSGVNGAVDQTTWTPDAIRFVILVGDAPSHGVGHKWNSSGQTQDTLRAIANDRNILIYALHIKDPQATQYHATTEEQFKALSTNLGSERTGATYWTVPSTDLAAFEQVTRDVTSSVVDFLERQQLAAKEPVPTEAATPEAALTATAPGMRVNLDLVPEPQPMQEVTAKSLADSALNAAFVQWIGSQTKAQAPRDVVAWVVDKDLMATDIQSLDVRLLINKRQLDGLRETLKTILDAGRKGQMSGDDFFSSLQAAAASTARDPDQIKGARTLAESGLVPEFLDGLPYRSRIMDMSNALWESWSIDEQDMFLMDLEARIMAYETIHDGPEGWIQLNRDDDPSEFVYPITLELLP